MTIDKQLVWVREPNEGFVLARLHELMGEEADVVPLDNKYPRRTCSFEDIFPAGDPNKDVDDNCELMFLNEATLLNNILTRYKKNKIYTYVANILLAVNPYKEIADLYSSNTIKMYQGKSLGQLPPHVFAIADKAFRDMKAFKQSQSIIVSGESGAGKTESTKYILKYLCELWAKSAGPVEQKLLDANPILEAFGNAKTTRNNNSSRFGKFIEVHFSGACSVTGGHISHYLLERSRVCRQAPAERNYHVFYLLCAGAPPPLRTYLRLTKPDDYYYLKSGCTQYFTTPDSEKKISADRKSKDHLAKGGLRDPILDDYEDFQRLNQALSRAGLSEEEKRDVFGAVAGALHLGNITFDEEPGARGGCAVHAHAEPALAAAAALFHVPADMLRRALVSRLMQSARAGHKGTAIMVPLKPHEACSARDALAKAVYGRVFEHVVRRVNRAVPAVAAPYYVGVLDIAGFEYFEMNSFEQFCINYCNEKLQQFFNERILKNEQELYKREGLNVPHIQYVDNQDCIDLIESKNHGIFHYLDEESKLPKPEPSHFTECVHRELGAHSERLHVPRSSRLKAHRELRDHEGFLLRHFAGAVCYSTGQFIEKNNDALHASLGVLMQESDSAFVRELFEEAGAEPARGRLAFQSVGAKFQAQLAQLMDKLGKNGTKFVRCVKPNGSMRGGAGEGGLVLAQLQCSGTGAALQLMEHGYPSRAPFLHLHHTYAPHLPHQLASLSPRTFCEAMVHSLGLSDKDFKLGVSRVFFRPGKYSELDALLRSEPHELQAVVKNVLTWLVRSRWRKSIFAVLSIIKLKNKIVYRRSCLVLIQKCVRGHVVRRRHRPRLAALRQLAALRHNLADMRRALASLRPAPPAAHPALDALARRLDDAARAVKDNEHMSREQLDSMQATLSKEVEVQMNAIQKAVVEQKNREEQERLRKIEAEIRAAEEAKRIEQEKIRQEEENRRLKAEMEARRKEEERLRHQQPADVAADVIDPLQQDRTDRDRLEQERRDHEMALRLARETNGHVEGSPPQLRRSERVRLQQAAHGKQKHDLSKWKYSELRDTINTSCDIELLEACRHEFHRRLKVYHAWKAKNARKSTLHEQERAPQSVMDAAKSPRVLQKGDILGARHRYFRIPFVRGGAGGDGGTRGWWYAHFDGQYVARQMELHPDKTPVLLRAGADDMQMCELSLDETGLTRKRGAEILPHEFERQWTAHGGPAYAPPPR